MTNAPRHGRLSRGAVEQIVTGATQARGELGGLLAAATAPATGRLPGEDAVARAFSTRTPAAGDALPRLRPPRRRFGAPLRIAVTAAAMALIATAGVAAATTGMLSGPAPSAAPSDRRGGAAGNITASGTPRTSPVPGPSSVASGTPPPQGVPSSGTATSSDDLATLAAQCRNYLRAAAAGRPPSSGDRAYARLRAVAGTDVTGYCQALLATLGSPTPSGGANPPGRSSSPGPHHSASPSASPHGHR